MATEQLRAFTEFLNEAIGGRIISKNTNPLVSNGIVTITPANVMDWTARIQGEAFGEAKALKFGEPLSVIGSPGVQAVTLDGYEYGAFKLIDVTDLREAGQAATGITMSGNGFVFAIPDASVVLDSLKTQKRLELVRAETTALNRLAFGLITGSAPIQYADGAGTPLSVAITNGGSVSKAWTDITASIVTDMEAITAAFKALTAQYVFPGANSSGITVMSSTVFNALLKNTELVGLFYPGNTPPSTLSGVPREQALSLLSTWFGRIVLLDNINYKDDTNSTQSYIDTDYIYCIADGTLSPFSEIYVLPTQEDPRFLSGEQSENGYSYKEWDGLVETNSTLKNPGKFELATRARIAILTKDAERCYKKKVINI